jgi:hypothetical protein
VHEPRASSASVGGIGAHVEVSRNLRSYGARGSRAAEERPHGTTGRSAPPTRRRTSPPSRRASPAGRQPAPHPSRSSTTRIERGEVRAEGKDVLAGAVGAVPLLHQRGGRPTPGGDPTPLHERAPLERPFRRLPGPGSRCPGSVPVGRSRAAAARPRFRRERRCIPRSTEKRRIPVRSARRLHADSVSGLVAPWFEVDPRPQAATLERQYPPAG